MRTFAVILVAGAWISCPSQARSQEPLLVPVPSSPVKVGQGSGFLILADINRDGHLDLLTQHLLTSRVTILAGDGKGHFAPLERAPMHLDYQPSRIAAGDLNNDGIVDLGITSKNSTSELVHVLIGDGHGTFRPVSGSPFTASACAKTYKPSLQFVDVNEDKNLDVVAANGRRNSVEILFGDGRGGFSHASVVRLEPGYLNYSFALGDIDGDGHLDLVSAGMTGAEPGLMVTMQGDGKGGFRTSQGARVSVSSRFQVATLADLNRDGRLDIVSIQGTELGILLNQGRGQFHYETSPPLPLETPVYAVIVADINRDQSADLLAATVDPVAPFKSRVAVLLGVGDGRGFTPAPGSPFGVGLGAYNLAVGDVNEDGKLDVAASSFESDGVTIMLGR